MHANVKVNNLIMMSCTFELNIAICGFNWKRLILIFIVFWDVIYRNKTWTCFSTELQCFWTNIDSFIHIHTHYIIYIICILYNESPSHYIKKNNFSISHVCAGASLVSLTFFLLKIRFFSPFFLFFELHANMNLNIILLLIFLQRLLH